MSAEATRGKRTGEIVCCYKLIEINYAQEAATLISSWQAGMEFRAAAKPRVDVTHL
jgi:hypothetical protein